MSAAARTDRRGARRAGRGRGVAGACLLAVATALLAGAASAQQAEIQVDRGPHYLGEPVTLQVVATQFEDEPVPEVRAPAFAGGVLRAGGVSDSSSTSISIVNGKVSRTREVRFLFRYELVANRAGPIEVPAFEVVQGVTTRKTRPIRLQIQAVPKTGLVALAVEVPDGPLFVGQKVPIEVVLRIDREAQPDLLSYDAAVPLFDAENVRFLDVPDSAAENQLEIRTAEGALRLPARLSEVERGGRAVLELRAKRTMIPLARGMLDPSAPRVVINRGRSFRRDLFGQRQATSMERLMAEGDRIALEILEVPRAGRPPGFAGAVGSGFTLEVSADRSVVQLGEPITLSFLLQGDGDLSMAGLPPFDAEGLFDPKRFRLPEEPPAGWIDEQGKHFETSVRVIDADVREIPAITYAWFDADSRGFEVTQSRPIALSVGAAQVIGANDVDRGVTLTPARPEAVPSASGAPAPPERSTSLAVSGANLAVDDDVDRVLGRGAGTRGSPTLAVALHVTGLALFAFAAWDGRRRARDPVEVARGRAFAAAEDGLASARTAGGGEAAAILGRTLRELIAAQPHEANEVYDALLAECDAVRFAPTAAAAEAVDDLLARADAFLHTRREGDGA